MADMFELTVAPWELIARGTMTYWFLFGIFRFVLRRDVGSIGIADVLLLVIIADASQNAMSGGYESVTDGAILVGTFVGWNYLLDWAAYRFDVVRRFAEPPALTLVRDGRVVHRNLRREFVSMEELMSQLRINGVDDFAQVRLACMESDGQISVIKKS
ncbi:MAG: YetF domain-containing protein [Burkholderiaceae bacterium]